MTCLFFSTEPATPDTYTLSLHDALPIWFGPAGVGVIVEALTDNRNRTASEIRTIFAKNGGNLGETGAVSFSFERVGSIEYGADAADADAMFEAAIEAGADDCTSDDEGHTLICDRSEEHTTELKSRSALVCRPLREKKKKVHV